VDNRAEGIVSKRAGSAYRSGPSREWLKTKVTETAFVIIGYVGVGAGRLEVVAVAELPDRLVGARRPGAIQFGLAGKRLRQRLDPLRATSSTRSDMVRVWLELVAGIRYLGCYPTG